MQAITTGIRVASFTLLCLGVLTATAFAESGPSPGKAAAHAALSGGADLPETPPQLPTEASDSARRALTTTAFGKRAETSNQASVEGQGRAAADVADAHLDAALRAAEGSVATAVRSATTDARGAAAFARSTAAKKNASTHTGGTTTSGGRP